MSDQSCLALNRTLTPQGPSNTQGLADIGFTIPTNAATYRVGEAMRSTDHGALDRPPENVASTTRMAASGLAHVARSLREQPYPALS